MNSWLGQRFVVLYARLTSGWMRLVPASIRWGSRLHASAVRISRGRVGSRYVGAPVLVLVTIGRRTGARRSVPLYFVRTETGYAVTAANLGADPAPAWLHNLLAVGRGEVIDRDRTAIVVPRVVSGPERERLWCELCRAYRGYEVYQAKTQRPFAVVALDAKSDIRR